LYGGETASDGVLVVSFMPDPPRFADCAQTARKRASVERHHHDADRRPIADGIASSRHRVTSTSSFQRQAFPGT
jgi:hypothetical protein